MYKSNDVLKSFALAMRGDNRFRVQLVSGSRAPSYLELLRYVSEVKARGFYPESVSKILGNLLLTEEDPSLFMFYASLIREYKRDYMSSLNLLSEWLHTYDLNVAEHIFNNGGFITGSGRYMEYDRDSDIALFGDDITSPISRIASRSAIRSTNLDIRHNSLVHVARPNWILTASMANGLPLFLNAFAKLLEGPINEWEAKQFETRTLVHSVGSDTMAAVLFTSANYLVQSGSLITSDNLRTT